MVSLAVILAAPGVARAKANWTILYYGKGGKAVAVEKKGQAPPRPASPEAPRQAPAPPADAPPADAPVSGRFLRGEVIVSNAPDGFETVARRLGFLVLDRAVLRALDVRVFRLRVPMDTTVPAAVTRLRQRFPGLSVDANHLLDPAGAGRTPEVYARRVLGWPAVTPDCGRGVRLGIIDGAVDVNHPALVGQALTYRSFHGRGHDPGAIDHGTAIAAMLIGKGPWGGLLPAAELSAANIFEVDAAGRLSANVFGLLRAVDWMVERKVHVINMSVAGSSNKILNEVLERARERGFVMVAAAGNGGPEAAPAFPAAYSYVIAVTAVDGGKGIYMYANRGRYIDFAAPGVKVWTAVPGGGRAQSGTSFAAPYVSVLTALEIARGRARSAADVRARLRARAVDLGTPGRDKVFGWGLIGPSRACRRSVAG